MSNDQIYVTEKNFCIFSGDGELIKFALQECKKSNINPLVIGLNGFVKTEYLEGTNNVMVSFDELINDPLKLSELIQFVNSHNCNKLVFMGGFKRPDSNSMLNGNINFNSSDQELFASILFYLSKKDIEILRIDDVFPVFKSNKGIIAGHKPSEMNIQDIRYGAMIAKNVANLGIGQGCLVQQQIVLGVENIAGTNHLINECGPMQRKSINKPILIKMSSKKQDDRIDLPVIGPLTLQACYDNNLAGIAIEAGSSIIIDKEKFIELAKQLNIFVVGIDDHGNLN